MTFNNPSNSSNNDFQQTSGVFEFADRVRLNGGWVENLGMSYSSPTFSITGADGTALSVTNPGYVTMTSKTAGRMVKYKITADQTFDDASGTSDIVNNLFGTITSVAWGNTMPMYAYAVPNDAEDTIQFMLSRWPHRMDSPTAALIGAPDDAVADAENSMWSFANIDETLYDDNPALCIGSFGIRKDASDDWTVQALDAGPGGSTFDGIGNFNDRTQFSMPVAQNGASTGTFWTANGGTAPIFSTNNYTYIISKDGWCTINTNIRNDGGTDGAGAVAAQLTLPLTVRSSSVGLWNLSLAQINSAGTGAWIFYIVNYNVNSNVASFATEGASTILNSSFSAGDRDIAYGGRYPVKTS